MSGHRISIDADRLFDRIHELGAIGALPDGGVGRLALTDADRQARDLLVDWMWALGLEVEIDAIGNILGWREGSELEAPIMTGSHIDSVRAGGRLDGAYGVLAGLEVVACLNDHHLTTRLPLVVAAFTNEEGARFQPDMLGSLVHVGGMSLADALDTRDAAGARLGAELARIGYAGGASPGAIRPAAFVELHIEQGPILEAEGITIGAVEGVQGISWREYLFAGQANHAGTTPMRLRRDAGLAAARLAVAVREIVGEIGGDQVGTIGEIELTPNVINVVPGRARMTVDLRNTDEDLLRKAEARVAVAVEGIARAEGVGLETRELARFEPVVFDAGLVARIEDAAQARGHSHRRMASGAGHDAQMLARIAPAAMIFVPSVGGISHNPAEHTDAPDLEAGANLLLDMMLEMAL